MIICCGEALIDMIPTTLDSGETAFIPKIGVSPPLGINSITPILTSHSNSFLLKILYLLQLKDSCHIQLQTLHKGLELNKLFLYLLF